MARNFVKDLKAVRAAIDDAIANGGMSEVELPDFKGRVALSWLERREAKLVNQIRRRRGANRNTIV